MFKKVNSAVVLALAVAFILITGVSVFLGTKDCYQNFCITGWEQLYQQWPAFWVFAIISAVLCGVCVYFIIKNEEQGGSDGKTIFLAILAAALLFGPWGKACTDKANGGVTAPGYQVQNVAK